MQQLEHDISNLVTMPNINVNQLWGEFCNHVKDSLLKHIPHKTPKKRCSLPWISPHIRRQIKKKNRLYRKAKQLNSSDLYNKFLDLKHSIQRDIRASHQQYISNIILPPPDNDGHCKQKKFWSYTIAHSGKTVLTFLPYFQTIT